MIMRALFAFDAGLAATCVRKAFGPISINWWIAHCFFCASRSAYPMSFIAIMPMRGMSGCSSLSCWVFRRFIPAIRLDAANISVCWRKAVNHRRWNVSSIFTGRIAAEEAILQQASLIITSTPQESAEQYGLYTNYQPERAVVIPPGTDISRFAPPSRQIPPEPEVARLIDRFLVHPRKPLILADLPSGNTKKSRRFNCCIWQFTYTT